MRKTNLIILFGQGVFALFITEFLGIFLWYIQSDLESFSLSQLILAGIIILFSFSVFNMLFIPIFSFFLIYKGEKIKFNYRLIILECLILFIIFDFIDFILNRYFDNYRFIYEGNEKKISFLFYPEFNLFLTFLIIVILAFIFNKKLHFLTTSDT